MKIPVSAVLLPDFSRISQQERLNPPAIHLSAKELVMGELADDEKTFADDYSERMWVKSKSGKYVICKVFKLCFGSAV